MKDRVRRVLLACVAGVIGLSGCRATPPPAESQVVEPMTVLTLRGLVDRVNENNARLPSLWARGYFEAVLRESPDDPGRLLNGQLNLQHLKPDRVRLKGDKDVLGEIFDLGSDGTNLWLRVPRENLLVVGTLGRLDPEKTGGLPLRPDLILQVLAVNLLPEQFATFPAPTLRINPDLRLHMVAFIEPATSGEPRLGVSREVWYDVPPAGPPVPRRVIVNDDDGRPVLSATLQDHMPVGDASGPVVAMRWLLFFPQTGGRMRIDLEEVLPALERRGRSLPNEGTFEFDVSRYPEPVQSLDVE